MTATELSVADTVEAMRESDYRRANPGDYACPHCQYVSLRKGATRCPLCHGGVATDHWSAIQAAEDAAALAAAERAAAASAAAAVEWERTAPERAAAAERAAVEAAKAQRRQRLQRRLLVSATCLAVGLFAAAASRQYYVERRPLAKDIAGTTPATLTIDYWFCFDADGGVQVQSSGILSSVVGLLSKPPAMYSYTADQTRGYFSSNLVHPLFSQTITITATDPSKSVRFRLSEPARERANMYFGCGGR